ncbi:hypothetical protein ACMA1I_16195 [Pontibacter sp. 13R65]|uniref:hypothetical protein n=1 Tax=Pontibacter sp. 13R65 TaxID=3127458 RepID=UPI00301D5FE6
MIKALLITKRFLSFVVISTMMFCFIMVSPIGRVVEKEINRHFEAIHHRLNTHNLTVVDKIEGRILYGSMILIGKFIYPEGAAILEHYINGDGTELVLEADYIKESPVIIRNLASMRNGETRIVTLHQDEDRRLSYALNPFRLRKDQHKVQLWQEIKFLKPQSVFTILDFGLFKLKIPDGLIHILKPKRFMVRCEWETI